MSSEEVGPRESRRPTSTSRRRERLGVDPARCAAVEDSASGIRAAHAAGMRVIAYPNRQYPPAAVDLNSADAVLDAISCLDERLLASLGGRMRGG